ncbi:hypothetical protein BgAZ_303050 [Babesia gibsoni]|uniref:Uncharacterized protein n=1 Tax=Babesia gibsoni TaxID=33632 RepID=A0AAD8PDX2_BABGI|nr:hypothetical protein BgAZ_303050 [Babesia gibsoni]
MSRAEASMASGSGFDEALGHFLASAHGGNLLDWLRQKCAIGSAITESFNSSDVDALTLAHSLSYRKAIYMQKEEVDIAPLDSLNRLSADLYCIFHQQLCEDWQSEEFATDRSLPIFEILPHRKTLIHLSDPKTSCLVLLTLCLGLDNVLFVGLHNAPKIDSLPGPYLGLLHPGSRESFLKALCKMEMLKQSKVSNTPESSADLSSIECNGRLTEISYLASEFDDLLGYMLCDVECYKNFTEPILLRMHSNRLYGKIMLPFLMRGYRGRLRNLTVVAFLKRTNELLRIVCRILNNLYNKPGRRSHDNRCFGTMAVICMIYSYLYSLLSVPIKYTPWNKTEKDEKCTCKPLYKPESQPNSSSENGTSPTNKRDDEEDASSEAADGLTEMPSDAPIGLIGINFASSAADAACVESTRRRDVMMCHAIGVLSDDGNWIKRSERYVDIIDNYKLSLCWYRRPQFSSCLVTNIKVLYPWAMIYHQSNITPCGAAWLEWQGRTLESWSSLPLWKNLPPGEVTDRTSPGDCARCLKRLVGLRIRDCSSFLLDMDLEIRRIIRKNTMS